MILSVSAVFRLEECYDAVEVKHASVQSGENVYVTWTEDPTNFWVFTFDLQILPLKLINKHMSSSDLTLPREWSELYMIEVFINFCFTTSLIDSVALLHLPTLI